MKETSAIVNKSRKSLQSGWKWAFFILLFINIGVIVWSGSLLFPVRDSEQKKESPQQSVVADSGNRLGSFRVDITKKNAEQFINQYLQERVSSEHFNLQAELAEELILTGQTEWLFLEMPFEWRFDVYAMEDGNIQLRSQSSKIGRLSVNPTNLFDRLLEHLPLQGLVSFDNETSQLTIHLSDQLIDDQWLVEAVLIDLEADQLRFNVYWMK